MQVKENPVRYNYYQHDNYEHTLLAIVHAVRDDENQQSAVGIYACTLNDDVRRAVSNG